MKKPRGVLFDLGDTVLHVGTVDWIPADRKLLSYAENETGITPEELQEAANILNREFEQARISSMIEQDIICFYRRLFDTVGINLTISYEEAAQLCWDMAFSQELEEGFADVLDTLDKHGIKAGILSNTVFFGSQIEGEMEKQGLGGRFSCIISSADYGVRKPHPRIFDIAARKIGLEPCDIWFAGDKPKFDVKGAINAGMYPVWYNKLNLPSDHGYDCLEIKDWHEFIDIMESL